MPALSPPTSDNDAKDTLRNTLNQQVGKLVEDTASQNDDLVAALEAIAAAINAKPSA